MLIFINIFLENTIKSTYNSYIYKFKYQNDVFGQGSTFHW